MSDVLLIHAPVLPDHQAGPNLAMRTGNPGAGVLHIGAYLRKHGYDPILFDVPGYYCLGFTNEDVKRKLREYDPSVIGIELNWLQFSAGAVGVARWCRELFPNATIVLGGIHATIFSEDIVETYSGVVDGVLRGEAELSFLNLVETVEKRKSLETVPGFMGKIDGRMISNPPRFVENLDDIPPYTFDFAMPAGLLKMMHFANINVCRGECDWGCAYCIAHKGNRMPHRKDFAVHSADWVVNQIQLLMRNKPLAIASQDIDMVFCTGSGGAKFLDELCRAIVKEHLSDELSGFNITAIPGTLTKKQIESLSKAGVLDIDWGCETGSQEAAKLVRRPVLSDQIIESVKYTWEEGILPKTFWMTGLPGERKEDFAETTGVITKTIDVGGIPRWVTPVVALPLTDMYDNPVKYGVTLRMHGFKDYMAFSKAPLRKNGWYPELITHETEHLKVDDILRSSSMMREFIVENKDRVLDVMRKGGQKFVSKHPLWDMDKLIDDTEFSFKNVTYGYF